jgi:hypothetical protein
MEVSGQFHAPATLPLRKEPMLSIAQKVGWTSDLTEMFWRRKDSLSLADNLTIIPPLFSHSRKICHMSS